jgi:plastocyanin
VSTALRLPLVACLLLAGVACSGSAGTPASCTPTGPTATVELKDYAFAPTCIQGTAGGTLALSNTGDALHSFKVTGTAVLQTVESGATGEASLAGVAPGTYAVMCTFHPQMVATLVVVAG